NGSWPQMGVPAGLVLGTGVFAAVSAISGDAFAAWGWRIPFLLSIFLIGVGLFIRLSIYESPAFSRVRESGTEARMPIVDVFRIYPKNVLLGVGSRIGIDVAFYILAVFSLSYLTTNLGVSRGVGLIAISIAALIEVFTIPLFGSLSDRVGRKPLLIGGAALLAVWTFPFFYLLDTRSPLLIILATVVGLAIAHAAVYGTQASFYAELFGTRVRYSGASIGYQLAPIVGGGIAPFIAVALLGSTGSYWPIGLYMIGMALITVVSVYLASETSFAEITEVDERERVFVTGE
ncbi:MAG: MFS transporter, partial [Actinomycetota bacterium]|nr:MFS transporter [Actinomycetota bacterium]